MARDSETPVTDGADVAERYAAWVGEALELAVRASGSDDVPVGALVIGADDVVIGRGRNVREQLGDPTRTISVPVKIDISNWDGTLCTPIVSNVVTPVLQARLQQFLKAATYCVQVSDPGTLTQTTGTMTWNPGGTYVFKYDASAPVGDLVAGTGAASLNLSGLGTGAGRQFNLVLLAAAGSPSAAPLSYTVATFAGGITPPTGAGGTDLTPYFEFSGQYLDSPTAFLSGNSVVVSFQLVPEPSTVLLIAAGYGAINAGKRRAASGPPPLQRTRENAKETVQEIKEHLR